MRHRMSLMDSFGVAADATVDDVDATCAAADDAVEAVELYRLHCTVELFC